MQQNACSQWTHGNITMENEDAIKDFPYKFRQVYMDRRMIDTLKEGRSVTSVTQKF